MTTATRRCTPGAPDVADGVDNDCDGVADGKMVASGVMRYDWDANGNQVRKVGGGIDQRYVFDARDRMIEVKSGGSSIATYGYDTKNLRVEIADSAGERRIVLDGIHELMELEAGTTSRVARYDYDPSHTDALLAQLGQVGGSKAFAVSDALGSVYGLTDTLSVVQAKYGYDVYGARGATLESTTTPWGVTGRRMDDTGSAYYRDRYFSPAVGRFLAADSMGDVNGPNLYSYVLGNPTAFRDPSGHFLEFFDDLNFSYRWLFCWGDCIDSNRADALVDKALLAVPAFSAYPKSMIPPFDTRKVSGGSPLTTILSSLSHYTGIKSFRTIGRFASRFATPVTILEGFFDWGVILGCGVRCAEECQ